MKKWIILLIVVVLSIPFLLYLNLFWGQRPYIKRELNYYDETFKKYLLDTKAKRFKYKIDSTRCVLKFKTSENLSDSIKQVRRKLKYYLGGPTSLSKLFNEIYSKGGIDDLREGILFNYFHGYWSNPSIVYFSNGLDGFQRWVIKDSLVVQERISDNTKDVTVWVQK